MARAPLGLPISPRNAHTLKEIARSLAPRPAECAAVSPDGRWIAAGTRTGVQIHDVESLRLHRAFDTERPVRAIGFGPDSAVVWIVEHADTACGLGETARAYRWQAAEPCPMETEITFPRPRSTTQVFASGAAGFVVFAGPITGIYDLEEQRFLDLPPGAYPAGAAAVSPRRDRVAFAAWEEVMVVDLGSGRVTARLTLPRNQPAQKTEVRAVAFSADGRWIAAGARQRLVLWDGEAGSAPTVIETGMAVGGLAFSPDGALIAAEDSATPWGRSVVGLWEVASGRLLHRLDAGGRGLVDLLAFGPHGGSLFVRHYGDDVRLWDTRTGRLLTTLLQSTLPASPPPFVLPPNDLAVSHDGLWEAKVGVGRGVDQVTDSPLCNRVEVVHRGTGQVIRSFDTPAVDLANLSLSPDNKLLLAQCRSGALDLLDAATGDHLHRLCWREDRDSRSCWQAAPRFSPDGEWVAAALEGGAKIGTFGIVDVTPETARSGFVADAPETLLADVFRMAEGAVEITEAEGFTAVVQLDRILPAATEGEDAEALKASLEAQAQQAISQDAFAAYTAALTAGAGITLDQAAINAVHTSLP